MSEKQAKLKRKNEQAEEMPKKKKGSALINCITTLLILAFLGLAGYALKDNIKAILPERPEKESTIADLAKEKEMTVDEFIEEFGLTDVNKNTTESEMMDKITVSGYAKYNGQTVDELLTDYAIKEADETMLWQDAYKLVPMSRYAESMGMTFEELKEQLGLPDEITEEMTVGEAEDIAIAQQTANSGEETAEEAAE